MSRPVLAAVLLTAFWIALWEEISIANVAGGLLVGAFAVYLVPTQPAQGGLTLRLGAALKTVAYFLWKLLQASLVVAWEVVTPGDGTNQAVVTVPIRSTHPFMITTVANMVSLIPGTLVLDVREDPSRLYLHVLHYKSDEAVHHGISRLEDFAIKALFSPVEEDVNTHTDAAGGAD